MENESQSSSDSNPPWHLSEELHKLHEIVIHYSCDVQEGAAKLQEARPHVSYQALMVLHSRAILVHRCVRDICEAGWTPVASILIRTLVDIYANIVAILFKPEDREFMAFRYLLSFPLSRVIDSSLPKETRQKHSDEIEAAILHLPESDRVRARLLIGETTRKSYWFQPEFSSPSDVLKRTKGDMSFVYRVFSGSAHGGIVGLGFLDDNPDNPDINPHKHKRKTPLAIVYSSRLLLEITYLRDSAEGIHGTEVYRFIKDEVLLPLRPLMEGKTA